MADPKDLLTLDETKTALRVSSANADLELAALITQTTEQLEREADREFVLRGVGDLDEYHDLANPQGFLQLRAFPVLTVSKVFLGPEAADELPSDSYSIDYAGGVILIKGSHVTPIRPGLVIGTPRSGFSDFPEDAWRLSGRYFPAQVGGARVQYRGGYATTAEVEGGLKAIALEVCARQYRARERKSQGTTSEIAQGFSIATKWDPALLSTELATRLRRYANRSDTAR